MVYCIDNLIPVKTVKHLNTVSYMVALFACVLCV